MRVAEKIYSFVAKILNINTHHPRLFNCHYKRFVLLASEPLYKFIYILFYNLPLFVTLLCLYVDPMYIIYVET